MSTTNQNMFTFQSDKDESLLSKASSRVFGLNQGVTVASVEYREKDQSGNPNPSLNIEFHDNGGGKAFMTLYLPTVYDDSNQIRTDVNSEEYKKKYQEKFKQVAAVITHFGTKVASEETLRELFDSMNVNSVEKYFQYGEKVISKLVSNKTPLDVFFHYQWKIKGDNKKTFLEIPTNMKTGEFLAKDTTGTKWTEVRDEKGLSYVDDKGNKHPFTRPVSFLESPRAKEQTKNQGSDTADAVNAMNQGTTDSNWL